MSWAFLVTALVIVATPGTGAIFTIAAGLGRGPRAAVLAATAALTGLAAVLYASGVAFAVIKYLGVAYLPWMAWSTWQHRREPLWGADEDPGSSWRVIASASR